MSGFLLSVSAGLPGSFRSLPPPVRGGAQTGFFYQMLL